MLVFRIDKGLVCKWLKDFFERKELNVARPRKLGFVSLVRLIVEGTDFQKKKTEGT